MIENYLQELKETWGYTTEELNDIRECMEEFGNSCYELGVEDGRKQLDIESEYYQGFAYGKKEDQE